ncbi:hypothetical protein FA15DRAFT_669098 [Coprinopsis marcescibilis]|uniref:Uncharacterized protein n=1 Tax=Coprinopsis marcescibilis TaxID=230819 RepID=A0A5C3KW54_COPMA|nr:hypothetical protein FA15DRAFT_669098 [Coprinopsis marcescibilis]
MQGQRTVDETPNARGIPSSAIKDVGESRQQRMQRQQSRFRDRGGIFVPTARNTLADILLGRKVPSPRKSRRSRSRSLSVSPQKPTSYQASPSVGKGKKRLSVTSSDALKKGAISVGKGALRRSPRKGSVPTIYEDEEEEEEQGPPQPMSRKRTQTKPAATNKAKGKGKSTAKSEAEDVQVKREQRSAATKSKSKTAKGKTVTKSNRKAEQLVPEVEEEPRPSKAAKGKAKKSKQGANVTSTAAARSKTSGAKGTTSVTRKPHSTADEGLSKRKPKPKAAPPDADSDEETVLLTKGTSKLKRKLSIVAEEEDDEAVDESHKAEPPTKERRVSPPPKKRSKVVSTSPAVIPHNPIPTPPAYNLLPPDPGPAASKAKAKKFTTSVPDDGSNDVKGPSMTKHKRKGAVYTDDDASGPSRKKAKATATPVPLEELNTDDTEPADLAPKTRGRSKPEPGAPSKRSRKQKENTPLSDTDYVIPIKTESKSKTGSKKVINGPRKSVLIRMKEPLPPVEDNDPDPIDFLS